MTVRFPKRHTKLKMVLDLQALLIEEKNHSIITSCNNELITLRNATQAVSVELAVNQRFIV